jgi:very-long-chain ceramide synthase
MRHYLNLRILWSEFNEFKTVGPYELNWATEQYKCDISHYISTALLASLQLLNIFWLYYILRIAFRIVWFNVVEDERSDDEETELIEERQPGHDPAAVKVLLNGNSVGGATGLELKPANGMANRKMA